MFYLFMAMLGLRCCAQVSLAVEAEAALIVGHKLLVAVISPVEEPRLQGPRP